MVFQATALAGPATGLQVISGEGQGAGVGQALADPVVVQVLDAFGNAVPGVSVAFSTSDAGGGVSPTQAQTGADGTAATTWTLGTLAGEQSLAIAMDGQAALTVTARADPGAPATLDVVDGNGQTGTVGEVLGQTLVVRATDAFGNAVPDAAVTFAPTHGSVEPQATVTDGGGLASTAWTLGTGSGSQAVVATAGEASPATFSATALPGPAQVLVAVSGDTQTGTVQSPLPAPLVVAVRDSFGNGVPGVAVTFAVTSGGGSVAPASATTGTNGTAFTTFTLGATVGDQTVQAAASGLAGVTFTATATAAPASGYDIEIRIIGTMSSAVRTAFSAAEARWEQVIVGDVSDVSLTSTQVSQCGNAPAEALTVDDLVVYAEADSIDGVGGILGQAGPCWIRSGSSLPIVGIMTFDEADLNAMILNGTLRDVILHEMGHVIGIGGLWSAHGLIQDAGTADPYFTGPLAIGAYVGMGATLVNGVPVENTGGSGTQDVHWRETTFGNELMTGFVSGSGNPLSALTIQSLADQGYAVDSGVADAYVLPTPAPGRAKLQARPRWEMILKPLGTVDDGGRIR